MDEVLESVSSRKALISCQRDYWSFCNWHGSCRSPIRVCFVGLLESHQPTSLNLANYTPLVRHYPIARNLKQTGEYCQNTSSFFLTMQREDESPPKKVIGFHPTNIIKIFSDKKGELELGDDNWWLLCVDKESLPESASGTHPGIARVQVPQITRFVWIALWDLLCDQYHHGTLEFCYYQQRETYLGSIFLAIFVIFLYRKRILNGKTL